MSNDCKKPESIDSSIGDNDVSRREFMDRAAVLARIIHGTA